MSTTQDADGWRALFPFPSHHLTVDGYQMHYVDEGPGGSPADRETLLFVHGNPTWSFHWRQLISAWRDRFRVVAVDHIGCGLSEKPPGKYFRLDDHIRHLQRFVQALELTNVTLVVQDWGGPIGLGAAMADPERFRRFVLINTGAFPPWYLPWRIRLCRTPVLGKLAVQGLNLFLRAALQMTVVDRSRLGGAVRHGYLAPYKTWHDRAAIYGFVEDIPLSGSHPTFSTLARIESGLPQLARRPFMVLWGMRDWCFTPDCLEKFMALLPDAEIHRLDNAGHWVIEDDPQTVISCVEQFIAAHRGDAVD